MNTSIISGIIGGLVSVILLAYLSNKVRNKSVDGELRHGWPLAALGCLCLCIASFAISAFYYDADIWEEPSELYSVIALLIVFVFGSIYSYGEAFLVKGTFDDQSISFRTPWTG
jgi:hypothetical protein